MNARARLFAVAATIGMIWSAASATWPLTLIPGWPHN